MNTISWILIGCSLGLIALIFATLYMLELPKLNDGLTVVIILFLPIVALVRCLRGI